MKNIKEVIESSMLIPEEGIDVLFRGEKTKILPLKEEEKKLYINKYSLNNGVIVFLDDILDIRVIPYERNIIEILEDNNYIKDRIHVPFSNGEKIIDKDLFNVWKSMKTIASLRNEKNAKDIERDNIKKIVDAKNIKPLEESVLQLSIKIPRDGVKYTDDISELMFYPLERNNYSVGKYNQNNGLVVFVDNVGDTRIIAYTKKVIDALKKANYEEGNLFVPFSNGEYILDCDILDELKVKYLYARVCDKQVSIGG